MCSRPKLFAAVAIALTCSGCDPGSEKPSASMEQFHSQLMSYKASITDGVSLLDFRVKNRELRTALNQMVMVDGKSLPAERKQSAIWLVDLSVATEKLWSAKVLECEFWAKRDRSWPRIRREAYCNYVIMDSSEEYWNSDRYQRFMDVVELLGDLDNKLDKLDKQGGVISILTAEKARYVPKHTANIDNTVARAFSALNFCIEEYVSGRSVDDIACGRDGDLWGKIKVTRILQTSANEG